MDGSDSVCLLCLFTCGDHSGPRFASLLPKAATFDVCGLYIKDYGGVHDLSVSVETPDRDPIYCGNAQFR
jgi:hypothetical protein